MSKPTWTFLLSGATTGWQEILLSTETQEGVTRSNYIPNPNAVPIESPVRSTQIVVELAAGGRGFVTPETKYVDEPVQFSWQFQSGMVLSEKLKDICRQNTFFKAVSDVPDKQWVGKITDISVKLLPWQTEHREDVVITLHPQQD